jgi:hypothetical protein
MNHLAAAAGTLCSYSTWSPLWLLCFSVLLLDARRVAVIIIYDVPACLTSQGLVYTWPAAVVNQVHV